MTPTSTNAAASDSDLALDPSLTPIFIGPGVINEGTVRLSNQDPSLGLRVVIAGTHIGDIDAPNDVVQVTAGGVFRPSGVVKCRHLVVAGKMINKDADVHADKVTLLATAVVTLHHIHAKSAEQVFGCRLNGQVIMPDDGSADDAGEDTHTSNFGYAEATTHRAQVPGAPASPESTAQAHSNESAFADDEAAVTIAGAAPSQ